MKYLFIGNYTEKAKKIHYIIHNKYPSFLTEEDPDIILVAGGDGSMLHAIKKYAYLKKPFVGIGSGTLNFLMNNSTIETILESNFDIIKTKMIKATINGMSFNAVNEISIGGGFMDYHEFILNSDSFDNHRFKGQGLMVSTPLGSTAINYNNGGQIIPSLDLPLWSITSCISEKSKSFKKLIESKDLKITLGKQKGLYFFSGERRVIESSRLFIDGGTDIVELVEGDEVFISEGDEVQLGFLSKKEFELKRLRFV